MRTASDSETTDFVSYPDNTHCMFDYRAVTAAARVQGRSLKAWITEMVERAAGKTVE